MDVNYYKGFMDGTMEKRKAEIKQVPTRDIFPWVKDGSILVVCENDSCKIQRTK